MLSHRSGTRFQFYTHQHRADFQRRLVDHVIDAMIVNECPAPFRFSTKLCKLDLEKEKLNKTVLMEHQIEKHVFY